MLCEDLNPPFARENFNPPFADPFKTLSTQQKEVKYIFDNYYMM